ncbi:hypothetical protein EF294_12760 [Gordonia oryzae]|uniref:Uncharacterized protein n=1 Tax=Gordonia oryzae TaxID=2487349 RepID=A0A3N4GDE1_9ACTN|nr:hypothetical protein EF294_12760 [Gordonia oryzae]
MLLGILIGAGSLVIPAALLALCARHLRRRQRQRTLGGYNSAVLGYTHGGVPAYDPPARTDSAAWTTIVEQHPPDEDVTT